MTGRVRDMEGKPERPKRSVVHTSLTFDTVSSTFVTCTDSTAEEETEDLTI